MKFYLDTTNYINTNEPMDISLPLAATENNPRAWYVDSPTFEPVRTENYTGSVAEGGSVNFRDIYFNPHGHGTHTECLGHITQKVHSINTTLTTYFFKAKLITIEPKKILHEDGEEDRVITPEQISLNKSEIEALIVRTKPNIEEKKTKNYSSSNPAYFDVNCVDNILNAGIKHLLVDLPSVDRENDGGALVFHHRFWEVPENPNFERTITELIFVEDSIEDGEYILSFQVAPFENDAAPSRPVLYQIKKG